jgi:UDP-4-amino-4,6-dideoxy-N-acetyl-beta-L-altrosamine transaminase
MRLIPYARQEIDDSDIQAVVDVLRSDWLTQGPTVGAFEQGVAKYCGATHAIAVNSATSALHLACRALDLGPGDSLWTSPNTFVASSNCALYCGAEVDFVDIDPRTRNMDPQALSAKLAIAAQKGSLPKIVIPVHFSGLPCPMADIFRLQEKYGFRIIEDASHAIGATYRDGKVGNGHFSDMTIFSFHPVKIMTTAEGGMLVTNRSELAQKLALLRSHGITRDMSAMTRKDEGPWYYEQLDLGYNYRMTELQAALGIAQLRRLDDFVARRRDLAKRYAGLLGELPLELPVEPSDVHSAWHLYVVRLRRPEVSRTRREVFDSLRKHGIAANVHYIPVHMQPYYQGLGFRAGDFPCAESYYADAISLPMFAGLSDADQDRVVDALRESLK